MFSIYRYFLAIFDHMHPISVRKDAGHVDKFARKHRFPSFAPMRNTLEYEHDIALSAYWVLQKL